MIFAVDRDNPLPLHSQIVQQIQLAIATNLLGKRIIMIPSGNALNLQTLDLNKALESILKR